MNAEEVAANSRVVGRPFRDAGIGVRQEFDVLVLVAKNSAYEVAFADFAGRLFHLHGSLC